MFNSRFACAGSRAADTVWLRAVVAAVVGVLVLGAFARADAATFTVTSAANGGGGSLRNAITAANLNPGADTIAFNITGAGVHRISLTSALPPITGQITINGYSQSGASANTFANGDNAVILIEIDGSAIPTTNTDPVGLLIQGDNSIVRGLSMLGFFFRESVNITHGAGIRVSGASGVQVVGNWVGLAADGVTGIPNGTGIELFDAPDAVVGTSAVADRNIVSGNSNGIGIHDATTTNVDVKDNYIGLLPGGNAVAKFSTPGSTFVCSGNCFDGISLQNAAAAAIGGFNNERNVIGGGNAGIVLLTASDNFIVNNTIGLGIDGTTALDVFTTGIELDSCTNTVVGGLLGAGGNTIAHALNGINVEGTTFGNALYANLVHSFRTTNQLLIRNRAIDLFKSINSDGFTPNDVDDVDTGANHLQNFPEISNALYDMTGKLTVTGRLDLPAAAPSAQYRIEAFLTDACGTNTNTEPEPKQLVALQLPTLSGSQENFSFSVSLAAPTLTLLTTTATTASGDTSELSPCVPITFDRIFADGFEGP